jgi:hypothetical protein
MRKEGIGIPVVEDALFNRKESRNIYNTYAATMGESWSLPLASI